MSVESKMSDQDLTDAVTPIEGPCSIGDQNEQEQFAAAGGAIHEDGIDSKPINSNGSDELANNQSMDSIEESSEAMNGPDGIVFKTPNSYKYPLLKKYYQFGPWVGRNRKAICLGCRLQTSSSQPDRLLKHLNRCTALTEDEKIAVRELMNERTANKRRKPGTLKMEFYGDDQNASLSDDMSVPNNACRNSLSLPIQRSRRDHGGDRSSQIDEALARFIVECRIPLKAIHSQSFIEFCRSMNPEYTIPSRETITNVLIPGLLNII